MTSNIGEKTQREELAEASEIEQEDSGGILALRKKI